MVTRNGDQKTLIFEFFKNRQGEDMERQLRIGLSSEQVVAAFC